MCEREHDETSRECWCQPLIQHLCPECGADGRTDCYLCGGAGWRECTCDPLNFECMEAPTVVSHRYPKGTPGACYFLLERDDA